MPCKAWRQVAGHTGGRRRRCVVCRPRARALRGAPVPMRCSGPVPPSRCATLVRAPDRVHTLRCWGACPRARRQRRVCCAGACGCHHLEPTDVHSCPRTRIQACCTHLGCTWGAGARATSSRGRAQPPDLLPPRSCRWPRRAAGGHSRDDGRWCAIWALAAPRHAQKRKSAVVAMVNKCKTLVWRVRRAEADSNASEPPTTHMHMLVASLRSIRATKAKRGQQPLFVTNDK